MRFQRHALHLVVIPPTVFPAQDGYCGGRVWGMNWLRKPLAHGGLLPSPATVGGSSSTVPAGTWMPLRPWRKTGNLAASPT